MSIEDWQTQHIDIRDLCLLFCLRFSWISFLVLPLLWVLKKYCQKVDIILLSLLCALSQVDIFLFLTGLLGFMGHIFLKKKRVPFVPVAAIAFYLQGLF